MFTGVHILSPDAYDDLPANGCIVRESYRKWVDEGRTVAAVIDQSPWWDLGTLQAYLEANLAFASGELTWPDLPIGRDGNMIHPGAELGHKCRVRSTLIGEGASVDSGVELDRCVVWDGAAVKTNLSRSIVTARGIVSVPE